MKILVLNKKEEELLSSILFKRISDLDNLIKLNDQYRGNHLISKREVIKLIKRL